MTQSVPDVSGSIPAFDTAIATISAALSSFESEVRTLKSQFADLVDNWESPAASTVGDMQIDIATRIDTLHGLLAEVLARLKPTRENYRTVIDVNRSMLGG